jgi:hypothetical protein
VEVVRVLSKKVDGEMPTVAYQFEVPSDEYEEKKIWIVKGEYRVFDDIVTHKKVLECLALDKDLEITTGAFKVVTEQNEVKEEDKELSDDQLDKFINLEVTAVVFHRKTLLSSGRKISRKFVTDYAEACIDSYAIANPDARREDFAVIEVDFTNKTIKLQEIAPKQE